MTEEVLNEEQPNPYNQKKSWHEGKDRPFKSSDELYFEDPSEKNKLFKINLFKASFKKNKMFNHPFLNGKIF